MTTRQSRYDTLIEIDDRPRLKYDEAPPWMKVFVVFALSAFTWIAVAYAYELVKHHVLPWIDRLSLL